MRSNCLKKRCGATDLDGVLADMVPQLLFWHNEAYQTSLKVEDIVSHDLRKIFNCTEDEMLGKFDAFYTSSYFQEINPVKGACAGVKALAKRFELYVITSRPSVIAERTIRWLGEHFGDSFAGVYFSDDPSGWTKSLICNDKGVEFMIEDSPANADACGVNRKVFLYDRPWNKTCVGEKIERVCSWDEIVKKLVS